VFINGASNTDSTHYRKIQSSSSCSTPFAGKDATGANFVYSGTSHVLFYVLEAYARITQLCLKYIPTYAGDARAVLLAGLNSKGINLVVYDSVNQNASNITRGLEAVGDQNLFYNCIVYGGDDSGIRLLASTNETEGAICCTSVGNASYGIYSAYGQGVDIAFSCYAMDNAANQAFRESYWDSPSGWNGADDATADLGGDAGDNYKNSVDYDASLDVDYLATAHISANGNAGDRCGRNPYNDVTATTDFDDFLRNDTAGDPLFSKDIAGNARPNEAVADAVWDVGASEYVITAHEYTASGKVDILGSAMLAKGRTYVSSGDITTSGAASTSYSAGTQEYPYTASGEVTTAGSALLSKTLVHPPSGSVILSGSAAVVKGKVYLPSGSVTLNGSAICSTSAVNEYEASGEVVLAGIGLVCKGKVFVSSGEAILGGTALASYVGAGGEFIYIAVGGVDTYGLALLAKTRVYYPTGRTAL
jgi:hypothetical protein